MSNTDTKYFIHKRFQVQNTQLYFVLKKNTKIQVKISQSLFYDAVM